MHGALNILVALDGEVDRGLIETVVTRDPKIQVLDYLEVAGPPESGLGAGDVLIVAVADYTSDVEDFVATATRQHPERPIVLMCPSTGNGYLGKAFDDGVDDIVALPADTIADLDPALGRHLSFTLEKAIMRKRGSPLPQLEGNQNVICVLGLKGGSGKTLTATNLSVSLAKAGHSVAIMDLDLQFGDVALAMGLNPVRTMYDLVRSGGSLDAEKLEDFLVEHPSGVKALLAPIRPDQAAVITASLLAEVQRMLAGMFEFVVIDTPPSFTPEVIQAIDSASEVLLVVMQDTLSLKNSKLGMETLEQMDFDRRHLRVLLNRANTNVGIERDDVLAILGHVDIMVPSHREITRSVNHGVPITMQGNSETTRAFAALAKEYIASAGIASNGYGDPAPLAQPRQAGPQRKLFRRAARST